jgi:hypothetical protein
MVTKTKKVQGNTHIWLREIRTGLAENVIILVDDQVFKVTDQK